MNIAITFRAILVLACLSSLSCHKRTVAKDAAAFRIIATDAGFEAPDNVAAGFRHIVFENRGTEIHEAMLVKLPRQMNADDYLAAVKRGSLFPEGALDYSGPGLTSPGQSAEMWLRVDPGQYVVICWNDGHAKTRALHPFTVGDATVDDEVPKEEVVLKLADYKFEFAGTLHKGTQVIRVETPGPTMHEVDLFRLHPGKTVDDVRRWRKQKTPGEAPVDALGGALDSHDISRVVWLRKNLNPGRYVLFCEMPLITDSSTTSIDISHADLGMVREFEIKE